MMGLFQTVSDTFFSVCSTMALTVTTVTEWTAYIVHKNYVFVMNLYTSVCYIVTLLLSVLNWILQAVFATLLYVFDFLSEGFACLCAFLVLLWRVTVLVYKVLCLFFTGVETVVLGLWNGGVITCSAFQQSLMDVLKTCESTRDYISLWAQDSIMCVCHLLTGIGNLSTRIVRDLWVGVGYVPATISNMPSTFSEILGNMWNRWVIWTSHTFMGVTRETYIGICVCLAVYVLSFKLGEVIYDRGPTLSSLWRRRSRYPRQYNIRVAHITFDRDFESDLEDDDMDNNSGEDSTSSSENSDRGNESDAHSELTLSDGDLESDDDHSVGSESDVSLNSQTFTSEDSDHEIDIQLPTPSGDHLHHSRSSTPSRSLLKDMDTDGFERELARERDKRKCVVCQDANKSVLILPCKHMCLCVACASQIVRSVFIGRRICPLCRTRIERVMDVYV